MSSRHSALSTVLTVGALSTVLFGCPTRNDGPDTGTPTTDVPRSDTPASCMMGPENTAAACGDGCSNDDDSFVDCADFDCNPFCLDGGGIPVDAPVMGGTYTIEQIQNRAAAGHPAPDSRVTVDQAGMIALTGRVLVGSSTGGASRSCRFAVWVGAAVSGDFTAIQVQELIPLPAGTASCFDLPVGRISDAFEPGDSVTSINDATYNEFCAGPMPAPSPCTDFEQSNIFLGGTATIVRGAPGTAPTGTVAALADLVAAAGAPGTRAVALEGGLLRVEGVQIGSRMDGGFTSYYAFLPSAPTVQLDIVVSNFPTTTCVRDAFTGYATGSTVVPGITGVLLPNFGRWALRIRDDGDIQGLTCP